MFLQQLQQGHKYILQGIVFINYYEYIGMHIIIHVSSHTEFVVTDITVIK